jgi:caffeoyl-CoA O-methyltransferase
VQTLLPREVDGYLIELVKAQHADQVLTEMETRADERGFPIVGRAVGRFLELQARAVGARRVVELGSGYGYSAYWFARAVGDDGEVICTDADPANAALAEAYLRRAGLWGPVRFHVGDALEGLAAVEGELDVVYCDIDKDGYPAAWAAAAERLRMGGVFLCDNVLWDGRVAGYRRPGQDPAGDEARDAVTGAIVAMSREVASDPRFVSAVVPIRDGVLVALRVA